MATNPILEDAHAEGPTAATLCDADGPIPTFPPRTLDARGRLVPISPEERKARSEAAIRAIRAIRQRPDNDPPGTEAAFMRGIDEERPHRKLFEGMY
ncbi:MAG: hypothetical protein ABI353_10310 [Isosphaeraceae bacterium]